MGGLVPFQAALLLPLAAGWLKERAEGAALVLVAVALLALAFPCGAAVVLAPGLHAAAVESAAGGVARGVALGLPAVLEVAALVLYVRWIVKE